MAKIRHVASGAVIVTAGNPVHRLGIWECGDVRFTDPDGVQYEVVALNVPQSVDPLAAIYLLDQMGLGAAYESWINAVLPTLPILQRETFARAQKWQRDNQLLNAAATAIGITQEQLDQMFVQIGQL